MILMFFPVHDCLPRWSAIAARLPGRTDNEIKNYWNTHIRKRLLRMGLDPVTHAPRLDLLDLSALADEPWKVIHPCKTCVSTAMPLCHWPCSCYPNHAMGQTNDWMNEIYPRWAAAHGVLVLTPVNWYQVSSSLKLMMDRLVCADGGNPDPTTTHGKDPKAAKYKMPSPDLPALDFAALKAGKQKPEIAKWMADVVKPEMAKLLQMPEMTETNAKGFGCLGCHEMKK
jgi:hypothetical protein